MACAAGQLIDAKLRTTGTRFMGNSNTMASASLVEYVKSEIAENKVVVFSKTYCPYCTKAKRVLNKYAADGLTYKVIELDSVSNGAAIQNALADITGQRTVPNVFVGGTSIGGGDETAAADRSGVLRTKLKAAGAITK